MAAGRAGTGARVEVLDRTVAAVAETGWGWTTDELEGLVSAAGWIYRAPSEGTVSCRFDASPGRAGAFLFRDEVTAVYLVLSERDGAGVLARRDEFVTAVDQVTERLGPPTSRCPGADPSVGWRVAAGLLEIVDRPVALDLWLRPAPRRAVGEATAPLEAEANVEELAVAAATLPAGAVVRLTSGGATVAELRQSEDRLTVHAGGGTEILLWPAAGSAYRRMAVDLVAGIAADRT
jgi:hypothetical protein